MEQKINKNMVKIIIAVVIIILVIGVGGGAFLFKNSIHSTSIKWEYMYLNKLKEDIEQEQYLNFNTDNIEVQFIELKENSDLSMVVSYEELGSKGMTIYRQKENEKGDKEIVTDGMDYEIEGNRVYIQYLYNISAKESRWYLLKKTSTGGVRCKDLGKYFDRIDKDDRINPRQELEEIDGTCDYYFKYEDLQPRTVDGQEVGLSKWEERFIVPDEDLINQLYPSFTITYDMKENSKVENAIQEYILKYNPNDEKINQQIKESIETQLAQLESKKLKVEVAREEIKSQEESKKQAEEESRKQEESKKQEEEESRKQAEEESKRQAEEDARKQITPEEAVSIWENFIQSQEYESFTKDYEEKYIGEKEYAIADVNADFIPELLIQFIEPKPSNEFCNTWLFVLDNRDIKLSYESYGYGRYVYSSKYNAIQVTPVNRTYFQSFYLNFFVLQDSEFKFLFGTGKDEGTPYYYSDSEERREISEEELSEYLADREGFDWQKL